MTAVLLGVHDRTPNDAAETVPIEIVVQPVTATAPTLPTPAPPAAPSPSGSPSVTEDTIEPAAEQPVALPRPAGDVHAPVTNDASQPLPAPPGAAAELLSITPQQHDSTASQQPSPDPPRERRPVVHTDRRSPNPTHSNKKDSAPDVASIARAQLTAAAIAPPQPAPAPVAPTWRDQLAAWITAHKSYPEAARERGEEGTCLVQFTLARDGRVLEVAIRHGSGYATLDAATVALLAGATVPPLPPEMPQMRQTVSVPLRYSLTQR